jgi:hypothetical protein
MAIIWDIGFQKEQPTEEEIEAIVDETEEELEEKQEKNPFRGFGN